MEEKKEVRINKYLSQAGICSRREADRLIQEGKILIDGKVAVLGDTVSPGQHVEVEGQEAKKEEEMILLLFNKPVGIVCTAEKREKDNVIDYINYPKRIYPVGRLDKDSEGLLLLTNNGDIVNRMMRAGNRHEKEYLVTVNKPISEPFLRGMAGGVPLVELGATTRPCPVKKLTNRTFKIILTQGLNRQIRRMCEYFGYRVEHLKRVRIMNLELGDLPVGEYRSISPEEYKTLMLMLRDSSNLSAADQKKLGIHKQRKQKESGEDAGKGRPRSGVSVYRAQSSVKTKSQKTNRKLADREKTEKKEKKIYVTGPNCKHAGTDQETK